MSGGKAIRASQPIDDMISTGGTIKNAIEALLQAGGSGHIVVAATLLRRQRKT
jgi:phosphoribosylpyrophosphate synthetase